MLSTFLSLFLVSPQDAQVSKPEVLRVGHVVELRGALDGAGRFVAEKAELKPATSDDALIGTVPADATDPAQFSLLGQTVVTDEETQWEVPRGSLAGQRVKVEGSWKGPRKFRASSVAARGPGRDRIAGRIDELRKTATGWEARVMIFTVLLADDTDVEHAKALADYALAPARKIAVSPDEELIERDEDDSFGKGIALTEALRLLGQLEVRADDEEDFDLDEDLEQDRLDLEASARLRLAWSPSADVVGVAEGRFRGTRRREEGLDSTSDTAATLGETWLQWRDVGGAAGFDITFGRQDFDDPREWLYDQNLDALRLTWIRPDWRLDVSAATTLSNGSDRDEESNNAIAYLSNNDNDTTLAAWCLFRDTDEVPVSVRNPANTSSEIVDLAETSFHAGVRAIGEWLPQNESWAEFAYLNGKRDGPVFQGTTTTVDEFDVSAWAYDIGTTWFPPFAEPLYFTLGYALGSGDSNAAESYRQTGYQDNNARFGGVTSFSYYGELLEPELSNLGISTLGVGAMLAEKTSLDLVFHTYTQDVAAALYSPRPAIEANLDPQPNGQDADLGWELDAIFGFRRIQNWDLEIVAAMFEPGDGLLFTKQNGDLAGDDRAYYGKFQLRYRF